VAVRADLCGSAERVGTARHDVIARIWRGVVRREDGDEYADYIRDPASTAQLTIAYAQYPRDPLNPA
jgi:hypothetical protein